MNDTISYYNQNAKTFVDSTVGADVSRLRSRFEKYLPDGADILDLGCGSGRDTLEFLKRGYQVDAIDGSEELCLYAGKLTGIHVQCMRFQDFIAGKKYDGIWACSSLLHLTFSESAAVMEQVVKALKPGGVLYMSYKYGDYEGDRNGRYFIDMTDAKFNTLMEKVPGHEKVRILEQWITSDVREGREDQKWWNAILRKVEWLC